MIGCFVMSIIALIVGIAGAAVDGLEFQFFKNIQTCASGSGGNSNTVTLYGNSAYNSNVALCYANNYQSNVDCYCVNTDSTTVYETNTGSVSTLTCLFYNGQSNCNNVIYEYPRLLNASSALDIIEVLATLFLAVLTGMMVCCPTRGSAEAPLMPTVVAVQQPIVVVATQSKA